MSHPLDAMQELACKAAEIAGAYLREGESKVLSQRGKDIKLKADKEAEARIIQVLSEGSTYPILAEESGESGNLDEGTFWVVDPLDGSFNYIRGYPLYATSIALVKDGVPILGVVQDVFHQQTMCAIADHAAAMGKDPIKTSGITDIGQAALVTGFPVNRDYSSQSLQRFLSSVQRFKKVRMLGSAAIALAYVALGRADVYHEEDTMLWDVAGGVALVRGAGGSVKMEPSANKPWAYNVTAAASTDLLNSFLA